jgi:hypothetical protein
MLVCGLYSSLSQFMNLPYQTLAPDSSIAGTMAGHGLWTLQLSP